MNSVVGMTSDEMIKELGLPVKKHVLENGAHVFEWVPCPLCRSLCREWVYLEPTKIVSKWERRNCEGIDTFDHTPTAYGNQILKLR